VHSVRPVEAFSADRILNGRRGLGHFSIFALFEKGRLLPSAFAKKARPGRRLADANRNFRLLRPETKPSRPSALLGATDFHHLDR
jgi:hypothetical protein